MQEEVQQSFVFKSFSSPSTSTLTTTRRNITKKRREKIVPVMNFTNSLENIVATAVAECENQTTQNVNNPSLKSATLVPNLSQVKIKEKPDPSIGIAMMKTEENSSSSQSQLILISRVLKGIPQSPHFYQLRRHSELTRENLMAAWDQAFEETAERIHELKTEDFWVSARKLWKTMEDLQGMGYSVIPIRRRLVEIGEVMGEFDQAELEIVKLKTKAENHRIERRRFECMVLSFQQRAEREGKSMVQVLSEVDQREKALPKYGVLIGNLAMKPFGC